MKRRFTALIVGLISAIVLFSTGIPCVAEQSKQDVPRPTMTTWMPQVGQTHDIGYLSKTGGMNWIRTWTVNDDQGEGSLLRTTPIPLNRGRYAVLFQIWHKQDEGLRLGELRAWSGDTLIASKPLISEDFPSSHDGGFQRAVLDVELSEASSDTTFELYYEGGNRYVWTGAVNLSPQDTRRPFYNIGHRCSTIAKVDRMIEKNANAIEFDLTPVDENGGIGFKVYHSGDFCYTRADEFDDYLRNLKAHIDNEEIALIELDCKQKASIDPAEYARALAQRLMDAGIPANLVLFSVPRAEAAIFKRVLKDADENGETLFDAGIDSYLQDYSGLTADSWVAKVEAIGSTFIGVGASSVNPSFMPDWMSWVQAMTNLRDANGHFKKSYYWTLNRRVSMRKCLDYGVDGVITNYPARMNEVLNEAPYNRLFKRATQADSQFDVHGFH